MLTDLSFLAPGAVWPPKGEGERLNTYKANRLLFRGDHGQVFREAFKRIDRGMMEIGLAPPARHEITVNYPRLISVKTAELLFSEPPMIVAGNEDDAAAMHAVKDIVERCDLIATAATACLDVSMCGEGILLIRKADTGLGTIELSRPDVWFPVVESGNLHSVRYHVLATPCHQGDSWWLHTEIHEKGFVTLCDYPMKNHCLAAPLSPPQRKPTGLDDFAVIPIFNLRTSDSIYGLNDYDNIQSLVCELDIRLAQIARILDKHTAPSMQGPEDALTERIDNDGNVIREFIPGQYFVNQAGALQGDISYITWDPHLDANYKMIDLLITQIRIISEMGAMLADLSDKTGQVPSGSALHRMLMSALGKIARIRAAFDKSLIHAIRLCSQLDNCDLSHTPLYIRWQDGLPGDPQEQATIAATRTGSKQTQSVKRAIMALDKLDEDSAEKEFAVIEGERLGDTVP